jgi:hypothetical protein
MSSSRISQGHRAHKQQQQQLASIEADYALARKNDLQRLNAERGVKDLCGDDIDLNK